MVSQASISGAQCISILAICFVLFCFEVETPGITQAPNLDAVLVWVSTTSSLIFQNQIENKKTFQWDVYRQLLWFWGRGGHIWSRVYTPQIPDPWIPYIQYSIPRYPTPWIPYPLHTVSPGYHTPGIPYPHADRMTHAWENITFLGNSYESRHWWSSKCIISLGVSVFPLQMV